MNIRTIFGQPKAKPSGVDPVAEQLLYAAGMSVVAMQMAADALEYGSELYTYADIVEWLRGEGERLRASIDALFDGKQVVTTGDRLAFLYDAATGLWANAVERGDGVVVIPDRAAWEGFVAALKAEHGVRTEIERMSTRDDAP